MNPAFPKLDGIRRGLGALPKSLDTLSRFLDLPRRADGIGQQQQGLFIVWLPRQDLRCGIPSFAIAADRRKSRAKLKQNRVVFPARATWRVANIHRLWPTFPAPSRYAELSGRHRVVRKDPEDIAIFDLRLTIVLSCESTVAAEQSKVCSRFIGHLRIGGARYEQQDKNQ